MKLPDGRLLPDLHAMGAKKERKDLFIEMNAMYAIPGTTYGHGVNQVVDPVGHNHMPIPAAIKLLGDMYKNAPITNLDGSTGIQLHVDAGPTYVPGEAAEYIVMPGLARGGEAIKEEDCAVTAAPKGCHYAGFPGTESFKIGLQIHRDAPVALDGSELSPAAMNACQLSGGCRRRFDPERMNYIHYGLYVHFRGKPKELCITGTPEGNAECRATNPDFHVPGSSGGVGDLIGGDYMVAMGAWGKPGHEFVGDPFAVASVSAHEMGHNGGLGHGGQPFAANCKPNYFSIMNYTMQISGLRTPQGDAILDYSRALQSPLNEAGLPETTFNYPYLTVWFAPLLPGSIPDALGTPAAKKFCNGDALSEPAARRLGAHGEG